MLVYYDNITEKSQKIKKIKNCVRKFLSNMNENVLIEFGFHDKWILYTKKSFIKLEIKINSLKNAKDDIVFVVDSRIDTPKKAIVFDRNGKIAQIYSTHWINIDDEDIVKMKFLDEMHEFFYCYESFLQKIAKDEHYNVYVYYTTAYYKLASLMAMAEGEYYNIYQPENFPTEVVKDRNLRVEFYKTSVSLSRTEMFSKKDKMVELFLATIKRGTHLFSMDFNELQIAQYFKNIEDKYPSFRNFRDIGLVANAFSTKRRIKEGLIFRSSSMSKYDSEFILEYLKNNDISYMLDLRGVKELEECQKYGNIYDENFIKKHVIHLPIEPIVKNYMPDQHIKNFYYAMLKDFRNQIKIVFEEHFAKAQEKRFILHCEAGKDRTGILAALLLEILGIERKYIIMDYLLSYIDTKRETIEFFFDTLEKEYGGSENYLIECCNVSIDTIKKIRSSLLENFN